MKYLIILILMSAMVWGVCVADVNESMTVTATANNTLCSGVQWNLTDAGGDGVIKINADNVIFDCNGSTINGDLTSNSFAISFVSNTRDNVTIKNCNFSNYQYGTWVRGHNNLIENNSFENMIHSGVFMFGGENNTIRNNDLNNASLYSVLQLNSNFESNNVTCYNGDCGSIRRECIYLNRANGTSIINNKVNGCEFGIYVFQNNSNINVSQNTISLADRGINILDNFHGNIYVEDNILDNNSGDYDNYNLDIHARNTKDIFIYRNTITQSVDVSILINNATGVELINNTIELVCIDDRANFKGNAQNEPCEYIAVKQLYKSFAYGCSEPYTNECVESLNTDDITLLDNTFTGDGKVLLYTQGVTNLVHDFTDIWNRSFRFHNQSSLSEMFMSNSIDEVRNNIRFYDTPLNSFRLYEGRFLDNFTFYGIKKSESMYVVNDNIWSQELTIVGDSDTANYTTLQDERWDFNAFASCNFPQEDMTITSTENQTLCRGTYHLKDEDGNGSIRMNANDAILDCNNTILIGNNTPNSVGIDGTQKNNLTIQNCNLIDYDWGIDLDRGSNSNIFNNTIRNTTTYGVYVNRAENASIFNNTFLGKDFSCSAGTFAEVCTGNSQAVHVASNAVQVYDNYIQQHIYGVLLWGHNESYVYNNTINNITTGGFAIAMERTTGILKIPFFNRVESNTITDGGWDAILVQGSFNNITSNSIVGYVHHGIDTIVDDVNNTLYFGSNHFIDGNYIEDTDINDPDFDVQGVCLFFTQVIDMTITNNECINGVVTLGLFNSSFGHIFVNNTITSRDYEGVLLSAGGNMTIEDNTLTHLGKNQTIWINKPSINQTIQYILFKNNVISSTQGTVFHISQNLNNETRFINFTGNTIDELTITMVGTSKFLYTSAKDFTINATNESIIIKISTFPTLNSIFNSSQATPIETDFSGQWNTSLNPNTRVFILSYISATDPQPTSIATGITDLTWSFTTGRLDVVYSGSGDLSVKNLNDISGVVSVYKNNAFVEYAQSTYTMTTAGTYRFVVSGISSLDCANKINPIIDDFVEGFGEFALWVAIIIVAMIGAMFIVGKSAGMEFHVPKISGGSFRESMISLAVIMMVIVIFSIILLNFINVC